MIRPALALGLLVIPAAADLPPEGWTGTRWIDAQGCAHQRAELGERVLWAQVLSADGRPSCGFVPTRQRADDLALLPLIPAPVGRAAPVFPAPGAWAQVGAYSQGANAERVLGRLAAEGLGAARAETDRLIILYAGPIPAGEETAALARLRAAGFRDAFLWAAPDG